MSGGCESTRCLSSVSLKYSYVLWNKNEQAGVYFESDTGLWAEVDKSNHFIAKSLPKDALSNYKIIDNFHYQDVQTVITNLKDSAEQWVNVSYQESQDQVLESQLKMYRQYKTYGVKSIVLDSTRFNQIFVQNEQNSEFIATIRAILQKYKVEMIVSFLPKSFSIAPNPKSFNKDDKYVYIVGESDNIVSAEVALRVVFDNETKSFINCLNIPLSILPLIGGLNFGNFKSIAKQTGVSLYLPNLLPDLLGSCSSSLVESDSSLYISGLESHVQLSVKLLLDIKNDPNFHVFYKSIEILKFKKDLIILNKLKELSAISYKYGVFIQLAPLEVQDSTIHFQGSSPELIELAINELIELTNCMTLTRVKLDVTNDKHLSKNILEKLQCNLNEISINSNASIIFDVQTHSFQAIGFKSDLINLIRNFEFGILSLYVKELNSNNDIPILIETELELDLTYHEFLSGKKNGKIIKILNSSNGGSKIQFTPFNDYVFKVELFSGSIIDFINSLDNLEKEFPSEVKFFIPESFHRQIIGTGGSLIQSIMRKYNVFVKFTNQLELKSSSQSGNLVRFDNVIIRCPSKNSSNIPLVQQELNSLLSNNNNENSGILNTFVKISKSQYRLFKFPKIQELEKSNQVFIRFPMTEFNEPFQVIEILGLEKNSIVASKAFINELASCYEFKLSFSNKFNKVFNDQNERFLDKIKVPFKILYNFEILTVDHSNFPNSSTSNTNTSPYHSILLYYLPESEIYLEDASTHLTQFLREHEFMILDRSEVSNNDLMINGSAASAAQHLQLQLQHQQQQLQQQYFKFNQQNVYPNSQQLSKYNTSNKIYQQEHQQPQQFAPSSIFHNAQQNHLTPSNNIYNYNNTNTQKDNVKKRPGQNNTSKQKFQFKRPF